MIKSKSKRGAAPQSAAAKTGKSKSPARSVVLSSKTAAQRNTKHGRIITMLRAPAGATLAAIMTAIEWQPHSVRGFLAGVVRKKLGLNLTSDQTDKGRVYRIRDGEASSVAATRAKAA
jgi:hypothetical protein